MSIPAIFLLAAALGTDAFSMAVSVGMARIRLKNVIILSGTISLLHLFLPLIGLFLGQTLGRFVGAAAQIIGAAVLVAIGVWWLIDVFRSDSNFGAGSKSALSFLSDKFSIGLRGLFGLFLLATGVSIDALTVGFGLGTFDVNIPLAVIIFGITAGLMAAGGFLFGNRIANFLGEKAKVLGALVLITTGIVMYFS